MNNKRKVAIRLIWHIYCSRMIQSKNNTKRKEFFMYDCEINPDPQVRLKETIMRLYHFNTSCSGV